MLALGEGKWFAMSETASVVAHAALAFVLISALGLWGVALAFALLYLLYTGLVSAIAFRLIRFHWSMPVLRMLLLSSLLIGLAFIFQKMAEGLPAVLAGAVLTVCAALYSLRGLAERLGSSHRLVQAIHKLPGGSWLCKT
jgi:O-antigen/teichoic acid export membrane protein